MVGEVSVQEANESGRKKGKQIARMGQRNPKSPCEFFHGAVVPYFMDNRLIAERATDKGITPDAAVEELRAEWLALPNDKNPQ